MRKKKAKAGFPRNPYIIDLRTIKPLRRNFLTRVFWKIKTDFHNPIPRWQRKKFQEQEKKRYLLYWKKLVERKNKNGGFIYKIEGAKHFLSWVVRLLVPDFLIGHPSLWDNLRTLGKNPRFKSLRMASTAWFIFIAIFVATYFIVLAGPGVINWPFTVPANYLYDSNNIEVSEGVAKLVPLDQTDDDNSTSTGFGAGTHDETQWDAGNNWLELTVTGQTNGSGYFTSRTMDTGFNASWTNITWVPQKPTHKELPNNKGVESDYPSGNANMSNNVLLMHMNENSGGGCAGGKDICDTSGEGNHGTANGGLIYGATGKLNTCLDFDGIDDYVEIADDSSLNITTTITLEAWVNASRTEESIGDIADTVIDTLEFDTTDGSTPDIIHISNNVYTVAYTGPGGDGFLKTVEIITSLAANGVITKTDAYSIGASESSAFGIINGQTISTTISSGWNHIVLTYDNNAGSDQQKLYINGILEASETLTDPINTNANNFLIGDSYEGLIDEAVVYSRVLSPTEVLDHYKRGILRLRFQVRSGNVSPLAGNFIGPDGTTGTYYSELSNLATTTPSLTLTNVANNQYFQYKAYFETDNSSYTPELKSVTIGPTHYPSDDPTIVKTSLIPNFDALNSFFETLGGGNQGTVKYQISNTSTAWYYYATSSWVSATGYSQTNTAPEVNTNIGNFVSDVGVGTFYFKAFLHSNGNQQVELDQIDLDYNYSVNSITVTAPVSATIWTVGETHDIEWIYTGAPGSTVNIWADDGDGGGYDYQVVSSTSMGGGGNGSYSWTNIPSSEQGASTKIKICSNLYPAVCGESDT